MFRVFLGRKVAIFWSGTLLSATLGLVIGPLWFELPPPADPEIQGKLLVEIEDMGQIQSNCLLAGERATFQEIVVGDYITSRLISAVADYEREIVFFQMENPVPSIFEVPFDSSLRGSETTEARVHELENLISTVVTQDQLLSETVVRVDISAVIDHDNLQHSVPEVQLRLVVALLFVFFWMLTWVIYLFFVSGAPSNLPRVSGH